MVTDEQLSRFDAKVARLASAALGGALGVLWIAGLSSGAAFWLTWCVALAALACFGAVALTPLRRPGLAAAANLTLVATGLCTCWLVAMVAHATPWLAWCCFGFALATGVVAFVMALVASFDHPAFSRTLRNLARAATGARRATP
ncbi:MAG TPA: hypothetical protein VHK47_07770 [Polyangia bacterium]|jgi:FtsH-binding integral membrane protein|nr:hypothetical protein [Polyangia bacterium]